MEYKIIRASSDDEISEKVTTALIEGWQCQGGVSLFLTQERKRRYAQAMVRPAKAPQSDEMTYREGDIVRIVGNTTNHYFKEDEMVEIIAVYYHDKPFVRATNGTKDWNVFFNDITLVRRRPSTSEAPTYYESKSNRTLW